MLRTTILLLLLVPVLAACEHNPAERLGYDLTAHGRSFQPPPPTEPSVRVPQR